jgi:hypothetical protein
MRTAFLTSLGKSSGWTRRHSTSYWTRLRQSLPSSTASLLQLHVAKLGLIPIFFTAPLQHSYCNCMQWNVAAQHTYSTITARVIVPLQFHLKTILLPASTNETFQFARSSSSLSAQQQDNEIVPWNDFFRDLLLLLSSSSSVSILVFPPAAVAALAALSFLLLCRRRRSLLLFFFHLLLTLQPARGGGGDDSRFSNFFPRSLSSFRKPFPASLPLARSLSLSLMVVL